LILELSNFCGISSTKYDITADAIGVEIKNDFGFSGVALLFKQADNQLLVLLKI